jgi:hypothetical protein
MSRGLKFAVAVSVSMVLAQSSRPVTQADLEAVYLYNFGKFVNWPADPNSSAEPFSICTLGSEDFYHPLQAATSSATLQGRKIAVRHLASVAGADGCHILYFAESDGARLAKDLAAIRMKPILTVSDAPDFLDHGGIIQFVIQNKRVRFAINLQSAMQAHLTVSSELLKVAVAVQGRPVEEPR